MPVSYEKVSLLLRSGRFMWVSVDPPLPELPQPPVGGEGWRCAHVFRIAWRNLKLDRLKNQSTAVHTDSLDFGR
jgi:hypothetical protein